MRKWNKAARKYLRNVRSWLPCSGKMKCEIMQRINAVLKDYLVNCPDADFSELTRRFGAPKQIAASYVEEMNAEELLHNLRIRRRIVGIVMGVALAVVTLWAGTVTYAIIHNDKMAHGYGVYGEIEIVERTEHGEKAEMGH